MSENLNRDFSKYEAMSTEELEEILRLDAEAPEGAQSDTELVLYILEVLASRRNTNNITGNTAQEAWESFQQNYMPEEPQKPVGTKKPDRPRWDPSWLFAVLKESSLDFPRKTRRKTACNCHPSSKSQF